MRLPVSAFATLLAGCGGGSVDGGLPIPPAPLSSVYKSLGRVCCGVPFSARVAEPRSRRGIDGLAHIAVCGADDGKVAIFDVPSAQVNAALALSFGNLASLPDAKKTPTC
jgi:hypothetical protein